VNGILLDTECSVIDVYTDNDKINSNSRAREIWNHFNLEIPSAFAEITVQLEIESGTGHLIMWFEDNYVLGRVRKKHYGMATLFEDYHYFHQNFGLFLIRIFLEHKIILKPGINVRSVLLVNHSIPLKRECL